MRKIFPFGLFKRYGKYTQSSNAKTYEEIAREFETVPQHVYELAHGKKRKGEKDEDIWHELWLRGIVHLQWKS